MGGRLTGGEASRVYLSTRVCTTYVLWSCTLELWINANLVQSKLNSDTGTGDSSLYRVCTCIDRRGLVVVRRIPVQSAESVPFKAYLELARVRSPESGDRWLSLQSSLCLFILSYESEYTFVYSVEYSVQSKSYSVWNNTGQDNQNSKR